MRGHTRGTLLRALIVAVACGVCAACDRASDVGAATPAPIAIIGVDGADWQNIDPLIAAGRLPMFAALKAGGATGVMRADPPLLSPIIWTTIATGRRPEEHGVLDFMVDQPGGGQAPVSGGARRTKALWEIFSGAGRSSLVAGWWATWPPDRIRGVVISDRVAVPHLRLAANDTELVYPPDRLADLTATRVTPENIDYEALNRFVPLTRAEFDEAVAADRGSAGLYRNRFAHARAALAAARTYGAITTRLAPSIRPAFIAVYFDLVDTVAHLFTSDQARRDRAVASAYGEIDTQIGAIVRALDPATLVLVMSDHGFYGVDAGVPDDPSDLTSGAAAWHRPYGIVAAATAGALAGTRTAAKLAPLGTITPLDVAPTVLARADLPVAADMPGRVVGGLGEGAAAKKIASYGSHVLPESSPAGGQAAALEVERLRALGYVSGRSAVTTMARVNLGEILFRRGATKEAIHELEASIAADPGNQRAGLWLARAYASAGRTDDAVRLYDRLITGATSSSPVDPLTVLAVTDLDIARGQQAVAAARLARLPAALSRQPEGELARGALAAAGGRNAEAERLFRKVYVEAPTNVEGLSRLVDLLMVTDRRAAAQLAGEAARRFPGSPERQALVGETALAERRGADAAQAFTRALALAPDAESLRIELGRAELMQNHADAALEAIGSLASRDAEVVRGAAQSGKGNWPAAVQAYSRAAADGRPSPELLNALGNSQLEAGNAADAVATLERSLALKTDQPAIRTMADRARAQAGKRP